MSLLVKLAFEEGSKHTILSVAVHLISNWLQIVCFCAYRWTYSSGGGGSGVHGNSHIHRHKTDRTSEGRRRDHSHRNQSRKSILPCSARECSVPNVWCCNRCGQSDEGWWQHPLAAPAPSWEGTITTSLKQSINTCEFYWRKEMILEQVPPDIASVFDNEFVQDWLSSTKVVMQRQVTLVLRNRSFLYARLVQVNHLPYDWTFWNVFYREFWSVFSNVFTYFCFKVHWAMYPQISYFKVKSASDVQKFWWGLPAVLHFVHVV